MKRRRIHAGKLLAVFALTAMALFMLFPIALTFLNSFCSKAEISAFLGTRGRYDAEKWMAVKLAPDMFSLRQYYALLIEDMTVLRYFVNSALYAAAILLGQALVVPAMAYGLACFRFRLRGAIFFAVILLMVLPFQVTMVPNVITLRALGLMNTAWAVILPLCATPFYVFLLRQYMLGIPGELIEAGMMDGASTARSFAFIVLPVCRPALGAAAALSFADCWNLVEQPLVYLAGRGDLMPLSVMFNQLNESRRDIAFAGASLYILPALLVYLYFQRDILLGIQLSELK